LNVLGCWVLVTLWVCSAALIYAWRFRQGKWRKMRVIETEEAINADIALASGD
jgi:hypothetical protein